MPYKQPIADLSRQPLVKGTTKFTDPAGNLGYSNEDIITSALVRIARALESGRMLLPTAVVQIQPRHADEFIQLVTEVAADRPGRLYITAWHLEDEHVLKVTLAYERGESLFFIGRYWEQARAESEDLAAPSDENSDDPNTWVLPLYCDSRSVQQDISELEAGAPAGHPSYTAGLLRRFLAQEGRRRQLLSSAEGSQGHD